MVVMGRGLMLAWLFFKPCHNPFLMTFADKAAMGS